MTIVMSAAYSDLHRRLAGRIVEIVRMRALPAGAHIAAAPLADELGVSRTPVVRALSLLAEVGAVTRDENRGAFLADVSAYDPQELGSAEEALYWRVANDRLDGHIEAQFDAAGFARRYEASRALSQRVLSRFVAEGVLERRPGGGYRFAPLLSGRAATAASVRFRLATEPAAFDEPGFLAPPEELAQIRAEQELLLDTRETPGRSVANFERNARFHEAIARWSGNPFLLDVARRHTALRRLRQYRIFVEPERIAESAREHLAVLDAIEQGDLATARRKLAAHICDLPSARAALSQQAEDVTTEDVTTEDLAAE